MDPLGPHLRVSLDHDITVLHIGGLSGSGATFGTAVGEMTSSIVLQLLNRDMEVT